MVCAAIKVTKESVLDEENVKNYCNGNVSATQFSKFFDLNKTNIFYLY